MKQNTITKPGIAIFLQVWQILELVGLFFIIPLVFFFSILLTGDSYKTFDFINVNIIPVLGIFLVVKIIITIFFFKAKRWTIYFNFYQNIFLLLLQLIGIGASIYAATTNLIEQGALFTSILQGLFGLALYLFLTYSYFRCLKHPYYLVSH